MNCIRAPVIGIVARAMRIEGRSRSFVGAFDSYTDAVRACGAVAIILPISSGTDALSFCDGVVLTGGEDLANREWWEDSGPRGKIDDKRDEFEAAIFFACLQARIPVLALCRGAQLVNCLLGGSLTHKAPPVASDHGGNDEALHFVRLRSGSAVAVAFKNAPEVEVLSRHAAFIARLGDGLDEVGWAPDGSIEAFEAREWCCMGALWHAEWAGPDRDPDLALFRWLVDSSRSSKP
jgi:putative glutamine amidotransferase